MALSTLRLRSNDPVLRQYSQRPAKPTPQDIKEILELTRSLKKVRICEEPPLKLPSMKPILPRIGSREGVVMDSHAEIHTDQENDIIFTDVVKHADLEYDPDIDNVCVNIDEAFLSENLRRSQIMLNILAQWYWDSTNSIEFLHWWLSEFEEGSRGDWFKMECSILLEEISASIARACTEQIRPRDIMKFILSVMPEHPDQFTSEVELLPGVLEILVSGDRFQYCELLSHITCRTSKPEICLATRSFCIISIAYNAMTLFKRLVSEDIHSVGRPISRSSSALERTKSGILERPDSARLIRPVTRPSSSRPVSRAGHGGDRPTTAQNTDRVNQHHVTRAFDSVILGYVEVLEYLLDRGLVPPHILDTTGRNLIFVAAVQGQLQVLNYLLSLSPGPDVNTVADNGNTPLHATAGAGNALALNILLKAGANPNYFNPECEGATPLHLAVLHGHRECVVLLLGAGGDPTSRMGCPADTSALDLAQQLGHAELVELMMGA